MDDKILNGVKASEMFVPGQGKEFDGVTGIEELPEGIRLYMKERDLMLPGKRLTINVYREVDDGGQKQKIEWCGKVKEIPEPYQIAERFGRGDYRWLCKWLNVENRERGLISDRISIGPEGDDVHQEWLRSQGRGSTGSPTPYPSGPSGFLSGGNFGLPEFLALQESIEEKSITRFERMAAMLKGNQPPAEVVGKAYEEANRIMRQTAESAFKMTRDAAEKVAQGMEPEPDDPEEEEAPEALPQFKLPEWLDPIMPQIKIGLESLLKGGPTGALAKQAILSMDEWRAIFNDPKKWGEFVAAAEATFGSERTNQALEILLNKRKTKPTPAGLPVKGKKGRK